MGRPPKPSRTIIVSSGFDFLLTLATADLFVNPFEESYQNYHALDAGEEVYSEDEHARLRGFHLKGWLLKPKEPPPKQSQEVHSNRIRANCRNLKIRWRGLRLLQLSEKALKQHTLILTI